VENVPLARIVALPPSLHAVPLLKRPDQFPVEQHAGTVLADHFRDHVHRADHEG